MPSLARFDLVSLRLLVAVVDAGSLTGGAERSAISVQAASKRIAELEAAMGTALLERRPGGVTPTAAGHTLYRHSVRLVADLEQMATAMGDFERGAQGHVRLWANTSAVNGLLPEVLGRVLAANPGTRIDLQESLSDAAVSAVASGAADLAIFGENTPAWGLVTSVCDVDDLVLLVPRRHALAGAGKATFRQALEFDFIGQERESSLLRLMTGAAELAGKPLRLRVQVKSFDAICRMVACGLGVAVLPSAAAQPHVESMELARVPLAEPWARRRLVVGRRDGPVQPAVQAVLDALAARRGAQPEVEPG